MKKIIPITIALVSIAAGTVMLIYLYGFIQLNTHYFKVKNAYKSGTMIFIGSQISSRVESIVKEIGSEVKSGDVLIKLDPVDIEKNVDKLKDDLATLENSLKEKRVFYEESMTMLKYLKKRNGYLSRIKEKDVETYNNMTRNAEDILKMSEESHKTGTISDMEMKKAEDDYNNTRNKYEAGKLDMELFKNVHINAAEEGIIFDNDKVLFSKRDLENQIEILNSQIELDREKIQREMKDYEKSLLKSPVDGVVNEIMINPGEVVQPGQKLMTITPPGKEWVDAYINERDIKHIHLGAKTKVVFKSLPNKVFGGIVSYISSSIQPENLETTTYGMKIKNNSVGYETETDKFLKIRVDFNNEGIQLPNGVSATVLIAEK